MMYFSNRGGFTLIETLVAISILLLVVIGPITVAQRGIKSAYYANEQVTAVFLAQEAVEAIRELRDTNALEIYDDAPGETWDWYVGLNGDCKVASDELDDSQKGCAFDPDSGSFTECDQGGFDNCKLYLEPGTNTYVHTASGNQDSGYVRKVRVGPLSNGGIPVQVEVDWVSRTFGGSTNPPVVLETWLYDHYQRYKDF